MESESGVYVKGAGLRTALEWVSKNHGNATVEQLINMMPPELRGSARKMLPSSWYPLVMLDSVYQGLPKVVGCRDRVAIEQLFMKLNAWIAEENLSTFYKALLMIMTPERLFAMVPRLFATYFKGIEVSTQPDGDKRGTCMVRGLGSTPYLAPGVFGWLDLAYRKVGGKVVVSEESWQRGIDRANPLVFHLDWS
jgi:hypothetical protein